MTHYVQAFIANISYPDSLDSLVSFLEEYEENNNVKTILDNTYGEWTSPKWCKTGDIVFFMHAKYAISKITAIRTEYKQRKEEITNQYLRNRIETALMDAINIHKMYGGKIFAIGRVIGGLFNDQYAIDGGLHWKSTVYAPIEILSVLREPIDISDFRDYIRVSRQSSITPVMGDDFEHLRSIIRAKNQLPSYLEDCAAMPIPIRNINKENWLSIAYEYRRNFFLEVQFRKYYVDYLLSLLGDRRTFFKECACYKESRHPSYVDNMIYIFGHYLCVEVKLNVSSCLDIKKQLSKYCNTTRVVLNSRGLMAYPDQMFTNYVLLIDTESVFLFHYESQAITKIYDLDELRKPSEIQQIKAALARFLS